MSQTTNPLNPTTTSTTIPSTTPNPPNPTLSTLPQEIHYKIFHRLTRPSKLVLGLTGPLFLKKLSQYYILERYRHQLRLPSHISFEDPTAQGAIIRFLCASGGDEIDDGCSSIDDGDDNNGGGGGKIQANQNQNQEQNQKQNGDPEKQENQGTENEDEEEERYGPAALDDDDIKVQPSYEETEEAKEDQVVNEIMNNWTATKFGDRFKGGVIMCADCSKFVAVFGEDGRVVDWANDMLGRQRWFRHCGPCEEKYGITRGSVLTGVQPRFPVPQFLGTF